MTQFSIPHPGKTLTDSGPYSSEQWAKVWRDFMSGILRDDASVIINSGNGTDEALWVEETSPASTQVQINIGSALVKGYWYGSDAIVNQQIAPNNDASGDDRIDLIILQLDITNGKVRIDVLEGTVAAVPVAPSLTQNATIWEVPIAEIAVTNGFTSIVDADIDNTVREYASLWHWKQGGTNQKSYADRQKLMGQSDGSLDLEYLSGFSIEARLDPGTAFAGGAWQKVEIQEKNDVDGLISVAGDVITFAKAGYYSILSFFAAVSGITNTGQFYFRLRNTLAGTTLWVSHAESVAAAGNARYTSGGGGFLIPTDNTTAELQIYKSNNSVQINTATTNPGGGETDPAIIMPFIRWG